MQLIEWKDEYSVGSADVDHEHKELIRHLNELHDSLHDFGTDRVVDTLGEIYSQISAHFALEEKLMREREYREYSDHKEDHERLLDEIADIMDDVSQGEEYDPELLSRRLKDWFGGHFSSFDARLHGFLRH